MESVSSAQQLVLYVGTELAERVRFSSAAAPRFRVEVAETVGAALALLERAPVAVLLADANLQVRTAVEFLERARRSWPTTRRVLVVPVGEAAAVHGAVNAAAISKVLVRPWVPAQLEAVLDAALADSHAAREQRELQLALCDPRRLGMLSLVGAQVAHDLASPLSALVANMERLESHAKVVLHLIQRAEQAGLRLMPLELEAADELGDIAEESQQSTAHLTRMVNGLRAPHEPAAPCKDALQVLEFLRPLLGDLVGAQGGTLTVEGPLRRSVGLPAADFAQALVALVGHAAARLSLALAERRVTLRVFAEGGGVRVAVVDTGPVVEPEQLRLLGRDSLSLVRELVQRCGGSFEAQSNPGGTAVAIWLPAGPELSPP